MNEPAVQLIRRFLPVSSHVGTLNWLGDVPTGPAVRWPDLEAKYRVLILAGPGAGKTFEARCHAASMRARGHQAFFIRIEAIDADFPNGFEIGDAAEFEAWLAGTGSGWFFLDSVDEAQLETPRALETAVALFGKRIHGARERAHVYITSREDAWQALPDRTLISTHLPHGAPAEPEADTEESGKEKNDAFLSVYRLAPLSKDEIRLFASYYGVGDPAEFVAAIERSNLYSLAERPFDLRALIGKWKADHSLGGRGDMLRRLVKLQLDRLVGPNARQLLTSGRALAAVRVLATAVTMTGRNRLGVAGSISGADRLDPAAFLLGWDAGDVAALLRTGIFDDVVYGSVRFRHRDMRELLTAEHFQDLIDDPAGRATVEGLLFRNQYGEQVIVPRLRPVLVWLILSDPTCRDRALALEPEIATEGGDPAELPIEVRRKIIIDVVERIASKQPAGSIIDNVAISRVAQSDLEADVGALVLRHQADDDVIFFLGRLVWQGRMATCVAALLPIAADPSRGIYARIAAARAVMTTGSPDQRAVLWDAIVEDGPPLDRRLLVELVAEAATDESTIRLLLTALARLQPYERFQASGLNSALHDYVDRLPMMADAAPAQPLATLVAGIDELLEREPHVERGECHVSEEFIWLSAHGLHAVERLVASRASAAHGRAALALMLKVPVLRYWRRGDTPDHKTKLAQLVPAWIELNDALYWASIEERRRFVAAAGARVTDDRRIAFYGHFWSFGAAAFERVAGWIGARELPDDRHVALERAIILYIEHGRPADWLARIRSAVAGEPELTAALEAAIDPRPSEQALKWEAEQAVRDQEQRDREARRDADRAEWAQTLKADPDLVRRPPGLESGQFSHDQFHLMASIEGEGLSTSRTRGSEWRKLIPEFGEEVARSYRDAAVMHWRHFRPRLASEGASRTTVPYSLVFGMAGLAIEFDENPSLFDDLPDDMVLLALRYAIYELNGFPTWLEPLYRARSELAADFIWGEMRWELEHSPADQSMHYIVHDVVYHGPWLHAVIAPALIHWLRDHDAQSLDLQRNVLAILGGAETPPDAIAELARAKIDDPVTPLEQRPIWYAALVGVEAADALTALEHELEVLNGTDSSDFAQAFVVALLGGRRPTGLSGEGFRTATHLKRLYVLMHRYIRAGDDIDRSGKGVYSPTRRDDAQDARNRLFGLISEIPGEASYRAIKELEEDHPEESYRRWMRLRAHERAVADADEPLWSPERALAFLLDGKRID